MRDFFKGWKRKAGVVTLALACVFAAGWVRSLSVKDWIDHPTGDIVSGHGIVALTSMMWSSNYLGPTWQSGSIQPNEVIDSGVNGWQWLGFEFYSNAGQFVLAVPYWSIVIPLTLVSGYLLLSKQPSTRTTSEPPKDEP